MLADDQNKATTLYRNLLEQTSRKQLQPTSNPAKALALALWLETGIFSHGKELIQPGAGLCRNSQLRDALQVLKENKCASSPEIRQTMAFAIVELRNRGYKIQDIATNLKFDRSTLYRLLREQNS